jgi:hypothetical protein
MIVNLDNNFENVKITFRGEEYILKDGEEFDNEDVIKAFPQYFRTDEEEEHEVEEIPKTPFDYIKDKMNVAFNAVMGKGAITTTSMFMIMIAAISFDIDGWAEVYHRLNYWAVLFMITSLYVAKMAIIKILSVSKVKTKFKTSWDKTVYNINHYSLRAVLISSLIGMVIVSMVGIYSSLAVNTVGDIKTVQLGQGKLNYIDTKVSNVDERIVELRAQLVELDKITQLELKALDEKPAFILAKIANMKNAITELPSNYKTKRRNMTLEMNKLNDTLFNVLGEKSAVVQKKAKKATEINDKIAELNDKKGLIQEQKESAKDTINDKETDNTNKAINYTAELLGWSLLELLAFINKLMTLVLEITYLSLTWYVVRLTK